MPRNIQTLQEVQASAIDLGVQLTPCGLSWDKKTEKAPFLPAWPYMGSCEPKQLKAWIDNPRTLHFGLICGPLNNIFVLDVDRIKRNGRVLQKCNLGGIDPALLISARVYRETPSGGTHYIFKWEERLKIFGNKRVPGTTIDIKTERGQIVLYGPLPDEGVWNVLNTMPDELFEALKAAFEGQNGAGGEDWNIGNRNNQLNKSLYTALVNEDTGSAAKVLAKAQEAGLGNKRIASTAKSALKGSIKKAAAGKAKAKERGAVVFVPDEDDPKADLEARLKALRIEIRHNIRADKKEIRASGGKWTAITDGAEASLYLQCISKVVTHSGKPVRLARRMFSDALAALAYESRCDPFESYLKELKWDGKERLADFIEKCFEVKPKHRPLARWALKSIMGGAVARAFKPGREHHEFFVFHGPQGIGKSSFLRALFEDASLFSSTICLSKYKEAVEGMQGKALCECAELSGINAAEIESLKNLISTPSDYLRLSYRKNAQDYPRRAVLCGSTNEDKPLPDDLTGLRRFCFISLSQSRSVEEIVKLVKAERKQLWGEAVKLFNDKKSARLPVKLWGLSAEVAEAARGGNELLEEGVKAWIEAENTAEDEFKDPEDQNLSWLGDFSMIECTNWLREKGYLGKGGDVRKGTQRNIAGLLRRIGFEDFKTMGNKRWRRREAEK